MPRFAIFDFDGTLTNLQVDWTELRRLLSISRISEIWTFSNSRLSEAMRVIAEFECSGLTNELILERGKIESLERFSVLTNNSEKTVKMFFDSLNLGLDSSKLLPTQIVGRETLLDQKENENTFIRGVQIALESMEVSVRSECLYIGDQTYELDFAKKSGLSAVSIEAFL
jgi:phosphoglycolate phosphatase-like HAD superfamily hydrolase